MERRKRKADTRGASIRDASKVSRKKRGRDVKNGINGQHSKIEGYTKPADDQSADSRLWVVKHSPVTVEDLVVHSKKVAEVRDWLLGQLDNLSKHQPNSRVVVLTGPAGVGKTGVVHVLAKVMDLELCEWATPTPTLWQEYTHHAATGAPYLSKLDEFEAFLEKARKFNSLQTTSMISSSQEKGGTFSGLNRYKGTKLLLIDDLPHVNDNTHLQRLCKMLQVLATSSKFPAIVVVTDEAGSGDHTDGRKYLIIDIIQALERGGARKISFNPVTTNAIKKLLSRVQLLEKCRAPSGSLAAIAESCGGDIRQALTSLQFLCLGYHSNPLASSLWDPGGFGIRMSHTNLLGTSVGKDQQMTIQSNLSASPVLVGRDSSLSLFHALGKFLHNKRHTDESAKSSDGSKFKLKEEYCRHPLNMEEPETILAQAHAETATVTAFLHENVLQFVDEEATDDVANILSYLSDVDYMLQGEGSYRNRHTLVQSNDINPSQIAVAAASSVAARGVLFANAHPAPRRWQSVRAPALWQVERQRTLKKVEICNESLFGMFNTTILSSSVQAMEVYPFSQKLPRCSSSSTTKQVYTKEEDLFSVDMDLIEDHMEVDAPNEEESSYFLTEGKNPIKQGNFVRQATPPQVAVEDEIEEW